MSLPNCIYDYRYEYDYAKVIGHCKNCGNDIHEGEVRLNFEGLLCEECITYCTEDE